MAKKVYDVVPPKVVHKKVENTIKTLTGDGAMKRNHKKDVFPKKEKHFPLKEILFGGAVILFLLAVYFFNTLPKADVEISSKTEALTLQEKIKIDTSVDSIDISNKVIPAQYREVQKNSSEEFPATGSSSNDAKSSGSIKIYNKINPPTPISLKAGTHFLSDSGKYFVALGKVTVPAATFERGKLLPGSVDIQVQAEDSGPDYNIGPSKFSVPKLSGTSYYYSIFAESNNQMTGGYTGQVKKVTENDISEAKSVLTKKLLTQTEDSLKSKVSQDEVLLDDAMARDVLDVSSTVKPDTIADTFNESVTVKISALVFKKQDLEKFTKDYIFSQLPSNKNLLEKSLTIHYNPEAIDVKEGVATLNVQVSAKTYHGIDTNNLIDLLSMKSSDQIRATVEEMYGDTLSRLKVNFWPFWVKKAPTDKNRIKIHVSFE